jgi:hypothetical protein
MVWKTGRRRPLTVARTGPSRAVSALSALAPPRGRRHHSAWLAPASKTLNDLRFWPRRRWTVRGERALQAWIAPATAALGLWLRRAPSADVDVHTTERSSSVRAIVGSSYDVLWSGRATSDGSLQCQCLKWGLGSFSITSLSVFIISYGGASGRSQEEVRRSVSGDKQPQKRPTLSHRAEREGLLIRMIATYSDSQTVFLRNFASTRQYALCAEVCLQRGNTSCFHQGQFGVKWI